MNLDLDRFLKLIEIMQKQSEEEHMISLKEIVKHYPADLDINQTTGRADLNALSNSEFFRI